MTLLVALQLCFVIKLNIINIIDRHVMLNIENIDEKTQVLSKLCSIYDVHGGMPRLMAVEILMKNKIEMRSQLSSIAKKWHMMVSSDEQDTQ